MIFQNPSFRVSVESLRQAKPILGTTSLLLAGAATM